MSIFTPLNQIKLTNVSIVRLKKAGKRFEIACYKNKVLEWRSGVETSLDEVLQIESIFSNVSKGQLANKDDLKKAFGDPEDKQKILREILKKGELQVGEKERSHQLQNLNKDIATTVSEMCINPKSQKPYTVTIIEKVMSDMHYNVHPTKSAKQQALDVIKQIQEKNVIPIERAQMRIRIVIMGKEGKSFKEKIISFISNVEEEDFTNNEYELICLIDPGNYRPISEFIQKDTKGKGSVEVLAVKELQC